jgi:hypothetical protein
MTFHCSSVFYLTLASAAICLGENTRIVSDFGKLPLSFEKNQGQTDASVRFLAHGQGYTLFLTESEAVVASKKGPPLRMKFLGGNRTPEVTGVEEMAGKSNYFVGNDPAKWQTNVPAYAKVRYKDLYPGIDLVYYGNQHQLEYDLVVAPGADPGKIGIEVKAAHKLALSEAGDLVATMSGGEIRWHKPVVYQEKDGVKREIAAKYVMRGKNSVGFELAEYDRKRTLIFDPVLDYSTYLGGSGQDNAYGLALDSSGSAYVAGFTTSSNFPIVNALQSTYAGSECGFVAKLNPAGSALIYSTYICGSSGQDSASGIAVDNAGAAYVGGFTKSTDFPTVNPLQATYGGGYSDAFVAKLSPSGSSLVYSTYLGGSAWDTAGRPLAVDNSGAVYVAGSTGSTDFPTKNAFQPAYGGGDGDAFVAKISPSGSALIYSTYLGGSGDELGGAIALDSSGNAYVTGSTTSTDFPLLHPFQGHYTGNGNGGNAFVAKLNPSGSALVYGTYLGGTQADGAGAIAVDSSGSAYVAGSTSSQDFPLKNPFQSVIVGGFHAFVTKFSPAGDSLVYSTYLGGSGIDAAGSIAIDNSGNAYLTGSTTSRDFPTSNPIQPNLACQSPNCFNAFVAELNPSGEGLVYSSYLGGSGADNGTAIAIDSSGRVYVTGYTVSPDFPTTSVSFQPIFGGAQDGFITKMDLHGLGTTLQFSNTQWTIAPTTVGTQSGYGIVYATNTGSVAAHFNSQPVTSTLTGFLQFDTTCSGALPPNTTCRVRFWLVPLYLGNLSGSLALHSDAENSPDVLQILGSGTGVVLSTNKWSFSPTPVGTSKQGAVFVTNQSAKPMDLLSTVSVIGTAAPDFTLQNQCTAAVAPYATCQLGFTWTPRLAGFRQAQIAISGPAIQNGQVLISISGDAH